MITLALTVLNTIILLGIVVVWFKKNYVIVDMESWNTISNFVEKQQDNKAEEEVPELAGGCGFFREYIDEDEEEE